MLAISTRVLNRIAPLAQSPVWRRLFSLNEKAQAKELARLRAALLDRGVAAAVADMYLSMAPMWDELTAINTYRERHPDPFWARGEISGIDVALHVDSRDWGLPRMQADAVKRLLEEEAIDVCPPVDAEAQEQGWEDEAMSMLFLTAGDWSVADAADTPEELLSAALDAEEDDDFDEHYDEWLLWAIDNPFRVLALEQCCVEAVPLSAEDRAAKLASAPEHVRIETETFWHQCPSHVAELVAHRMFWLAHAERGRRRGNPEWTPLYPLPPWWEDEDPVHTFERWCVPPDDVQAR